VLTESCAHVQNAQSVSIDDTYTDLTNLGKIFNIESRSGAVIASMKAHIPVAQQKVAGLITGAGHAMPTAEIALGGGVNIFAA